MNIINKKFILCQNYKVHKYISKPLFFYHVPKCAGTTFSVLLSHLFEKSHRLEGPAFKNNDKSGKTALEFFEKNKKNILKEKYNFIHGHVPISLHKYFKEEYFFVTVLREPIERTISHYNWCIVKKYFSKNEDLELLFLKKKLPSNLITSMFLGENRHLNKNDSVNVALQNLVEKIDVIVDINKFLLFIKETISHFQFPSLLFQNQQIAPKIIEKLSKKNFEIVKKYNELDIELYKKIMQRKFDYKRNYFLCGNKENLLNKTDLYLYSSPDLLLNGKKNIILNKNQINKILYDLKKNNFQIKSV